MRNFFALVTLFSALNSFAAMPDKVLIIGTVENITEKVVTLKTPSGSVKVPRNALRKPTVHIGEEARADVTLQGLQQLNG